MYILLFCILLNGELKQINGSPTYSFKTQSECEYGLMQADDIIENINKELLNNGKLTNIIPICLLLTK